MSQSKQRPLGPAGGHYDRSPRPRGVALADRGGDVSCRCAGGNRRTAALGMACGSSDILLAGMGAVVRQDHFGKSRTNRGSVRAGFQPRADRASDVGWSPLRQVWWITLLTGSARNPRNQAWELLLCASADDRASEAKIR